MEPFLHLACCERQHGADTQLNKTPRASVPDESFTIALLAFCTFLLKWFWCVIFEMAGIEIPEQTFPSEIFQAKERAPEASPQSVLQRYRDGYWSRNVSRKLSGLGT